MTLEGLSGVISTHWGPTAQIVAPPLSAEPLPPSAPRDDETKTPSMGVPSNGGTEFCSGVSFPGAPSDENAVQA